MQTVGYFDPKARDPEIMMPKACHLIAIFNAALLLATPAEAQSSDALDGKLRDLLPDRPEPPTLQPDTPYLKPAEPFSPTAIAQENAYDGGTFRVGSVLIESSAGIDHAIFDKAIEPFLGAEASSADLVRLAQEIAAVARTNGLPLAYAYVPPQKVELGIVRVVLTLGAIDELRIEGSDNKALQALLSGLAGKVVLQAELERQLLLANDLPAITVNSAEFVVENDRRILVVRVQEEAESRIRFTVDNSGSKNIGPLRGRMVLDTSAWLNDSDAMSAMIQANPVDPDELLGASIAYSIGVNRRGTRVSALAARSQSQLGSHRDFDTRDITSQYVSAIVSHPLRRLRGSSAWLEGQIEYAQIEQEQQAALIASDTVVALSVSLASSMKLREGWLRSGVQMRQGLGIFGADGADPGLSSQPDAEAEFSSVRAWINWTGSPAENLVLRLAMSGQWANDPLPSSEEITLGGSYIGRGYEPYILSGDDGILASAELGYEFSDPVTWLDRLEPYAFVDGGWVEQIGAGVGGGGLMSGGGGVRANFGPLDLQLETASPIAWDAEGDKEDASRVNFRIGVGF
jgi:hemolysin activation/secretion protein